MNDDEHRKIIITRISSSEHERIPVKPINRWLVIALLIPVVALMAVLGVVFFAAFLALFAIAAVGFSIRLWWLRRKFQNSTQGTDQEAERQTDDDQTVIIEDAEIVEETEVSRKKKKQSRSRSDDS